MNILQLYEDFNITHYTEGFKYCRPGWVNVDCPFCVAHTPGPHLGFELSTNHFNCWSCGWHPNDLTIAKLLHISINQAKETIKLYGGVAFKTKEAVIKIRVKAHRLPSNTMPLQRNHQQYLEGRNFDPDKLEREWGLLGTGPVSILDEINYKHRIIIPFIWQNQQVSFDSRDITGKHKAKYMACPKDRELMPHKHILYGKQECWKDTGIGVEGPTDVWRFGTLSCAVSGIEYTPMQVRVIAKRFKRFAVCFDGDEIQARKQADKLVADLKFRGVDAWRVDIDGDPGDMEQSEADYLVKQLIK